MQGDRPAFTLVSLFLATNILGLVAATNLQHAPAVQAAAQTYQAPSSGVIVFAMIGLATLALLALYRYDLQIIIKAWFTLALFLTAAIFFNAFLAPTISLGLAALIMIARHQTNRPTRRNILDVVPFAGTGALFGSIISAPAAFVLLVLLSLYDYFSVYISEHMVALAKQGAASNTFLGFTYQKDDTPLATINDAKEVDQEVDADAIQVGVLGGGDVIIPMIFAISLSTMFTLGAAVAAIIGATVALYLLLTQLARTSFVPAIPVLTVGGFTGFVFWLFLASIL